LKLLKRRPDGMEEGDLEDMGRKTEDGVELESHRICTTLPNGGNGSFQVMYSLPACI